VIWSFPATVKARAYSSWPAKERDILPLFLDILYKLDQDVRCSVAQMRFAVKSPFSAALFAEGILTPEKIENASNIQVGSLPAKLVTEVKFSFLGSIDIVIQAGEAVFEKDSAGTPYWFLPFRHDGGIAFDPNKPKIFALVW